MSSINNRDMIGRRRSAGTHHTTGESWMKAIWVRLFQNDEFIGVTAVDVVADGRITISRITDSVKHRCSDILQNASFIRMYSATDEEYLLPGSLMWQSRSHGGSRKESALLMKFTMPVAKRSEIKKSTQARMDRLLEQMDQQHAQMMESYAMIREFRSEMEQHWDQLRQTQSEMFQTTREQWEQLLQSQTVMSQNLQNQLELILERQQQIMLIQPHMQEQMDSMKKELQEQMAELRQLCLIQLTHH